VKLAKKEAPAKPAPKVTILPSIFKSMLTTFKKPAATTKAAAPKKAAAKKTEKAEKAEKPKTKKSTAGVKKSVGRPKANTAKPRKTSTAVSHHAGYSPGLSH
jgi:histone H1/5